VGELASLLTFGLPAQPPSGVPLLNTGITALTACPRSLAMKASITDDSPLRSSGGMRRLIDHLAPGSSTVCTYPDKSETLTCVLNFSPNSISEGVRLDGQSTELIRSSRHRAVAAGK
jgi:hypothetical protein